MAIDIHLIRHAETEANRTGLWQGQGNSPLSETGARQAAALGERLHAKEFDFVVCSDLGRAEATARQFASSPHLDPVWREADIGAWEGLTRAEVAGQFGNEVTALMAGEDTRMGGGESVAEFELRMDAAFDSLIARMSDGQSAAVVSHGGVIGGLIARVLGLRGSRPRSLARLSNTAISVVRVEATREQLVSFNDADHHPPTRVPGVVLVRHGETEANLSGVWHGVTDGPLTETGRRQAKLAAERVDVDLVYSSPLSRARDTAAAIAERHGLDHRIDDRVGEMDFGAWEDLRPEEIRDRWPDEFRRAYVENDDIPRGGTGETFAAVAVRMKAAVGDLSQSNATVPLAVVSHGSAIRAYLANLIGLGYEDRHRLASPINTGISRVETGEFGSLVMARFNNTPHLES